MLQVFDTHIHAYRVTFLTPTKRKKTQKLVNIAFRCGQASLFGHGASVELVPGMEKCWRIPVQIENEIEYRSGGT